MDRKVVRRVLEVSAPEGMSDEEIDMHIGGVFELADDRLAARDMYVELTTARPEAGPTQGEPE